MAVDLTAALLAVTRLLDDDNSAIELYKANFATPQDLEGMRFWAQGEYNRIQSGFASTDTAFRLIAGVLQDLIAAIDEAGGAPGNGCECEDGEQGPQGEQGPAGPQGEPGEDGNAGDLIDDAVVRYELTWSSQKISQELANKAGTNDLHSQEHLLFGPDQTDVNTTTPIQPNEVLDWDGTHFVPDRRTKVHFSVTKPLEAESLPGDIWAAT